MRGSITVITVHKLLDRLPNNCYTKDVRRYATLLYVTLR